MSQNVEISAPAGVQTWHEPRSFGEFQCTGASCEDTCCRGWGIGVDRQTFDRYQELADPEFGPKLRQLVNITVANKGHQHAAIVLEDAQCPLLVDKLCSVHTKLGEEYLGQACATFPRVVNPVDGAIERSLDLSCPEAARLILLNPEPDLFQEFHAPVGLMDSRLLQIAGNRTHRSQPQHSDLVRGFALGILQNRAYPVAKRMMLLSYFCSKMQELEDNATQHQIPEVLEGFEYAIRASLFDEHLNQTSAHVGAQLALVLEMVVGRVSLDYTSERYRELYGEFIQGLELEADSTIADLGERYTEAYFQYFEPFLRTREYILEHYLVSYAYKTMFPYGKTSMADQYMVLAAYFATIRSLAVGLAGHYKSDFNEMHLVRTIQVCARALEHCTSYPARVLEILASKGIRTVADTAVLTQNPSIPSGRPEAEPAVICDAIAPFKALGYASGR